MLIILESVKCDNIDIKDEQEIIENKCSLNLFKKLLLIPNPRITRKILTFVDSRL